MVLAAAKSRDRETEVIAWTQMETRYFWNYRSRARRWGYASPSLKTCGHVLGASGHTEQHPIRITRRRFLLARQAALFLYPTPDSFVEVDHGIPE